MTAKEKAAALSPIMTAFAIALLIGVIWLIVHRNPYDDKRLTQKVKTAAWKGRENMAAWIISGIPSAIVSAIVRMIARDK